MKRDKTSEETKRIKYRNEFLKRRWECWVEKQETADSATRAEIAEIPEFLKTKPKEEKHDHLKAPAIPFARDFSREFWEVYSCLQFPKTGLPSIGILRYKDSAVSASQLDYNEINLPPEDIRKHEDSLAVDYIKKGKFIPIIVNLNRRKGDIIRDIEHLLYTLDREAKILRKDFKRPKIHWEEFESYLKVYDLKKNDPKMTWTEIAKILFPDEVYKSVSPHRKLERELAFPTAKDKVRHYWRQANKMIHKGGWKEI